MNSSKPITLALILIGLFTVSVSSQSAGASVSVGETLCNRIDEIDQLPHHDESGVDGVYDALVEAGESVIPCLIEKITDTTIMDDPRCPVISKATTVGDVAYFVLVMITKIEFTEMLPADVREEFKTRGVYAYHDYVDRKGARKDLQLKLREWFGRKKEN